MTKTPRISRANAKANAAARTRISTRKVIADARQVATDAEQADAAAKAPRKNRRDAAIHARVAAAATPASTDPNPIPIDVFGEAAELRAGADQIEAAREATIIPNPDGADFVETLNHAVTNEVEVANAETAEAEATPCAGAPDRPIVETEHLIEYPHADPKPEVPDMVGYLNEGLPTEPADRIPNPDDVDFVEALNTEVTNEVEAANARINDAPRTETRSSGDMALVVDVGPRECTTLATRIATMLGRKVLIVDMISLRTLQTVEPPAPVATTAGGGKARSVIIAACTRPEGATSKELFEATGWKYASWSHQLKIAATAGGFQADIRKVDGTTRYFLTKPTAATPEPTTESDADSEAA
jgi:hypothetical protein